MRNPAFRMRKQDLRILQPRTLARHVRKEATPDPRTTEDGSGRNLTTIDSLREHVVKPMYQLMLFVNTLASQRHYWERHR